MTSLSDKQVSHLRQLVDIPDLSGTRYEIEKRLASGGMSSVYLAYDRALERHVALKVLTVVDDAGAISGRMIREAQIIAQLEHPGIIPIHDVGALTDGRVYYTMKYVEGATLEEWRSPARERHELLRAVQRICEAVAFAHARGVLHRDLKPANVMIGAFGEVLVMDWGIALRQRSDFSEACHPESETRDDASPSKTKDGVVLGTPGSMSPEQAAGQSSRIDRRSDIYGIGAVLYFVLTGRPPASGDSVAEAIENTRLGNIRAPRDLDPEIPKPLAAICMKSLAHDPADRYQHVMALHEDLQKYLEGQPVSAYQEGIWEKFVRWVGRHQFILVIALIYLLARFLILFWRGI